MSVSASIALQATVTEILEGNTASASPANRTVTHALFNVAKTLNGTSTPAVTQQAHFVVALTTGAATVDLTALTGTNNVTVNGTGLVVRYVRVNNLGENPLTIEPGDSNPHDFFGESDVTAGGTVAVYAPGTTTTIASGARIWKLTGSGAEQSQWTVILGAP